MVTPQQLLFCGGRSGLYWANGAAMLESWLEVEAAGTRATWVKRKSGAIPRPKMVFGTELHWFQFRKGNCEGRSEVRKA